MPELITSTKQGLQLEKVKKVFFYPRIKPKIIPFDLSPFYKTECISERFAPAEFREKAGVLLVATSNPELDYLRWLREGTEYHKPHQFESTFCPRGVELRFIFTLDKNINGLIRFHKLEN